MKIKLFFVTIILAFFANNTLASSILQSCTNASGTILISNFNSLKVITGKYASDGTYKEQSLMFDLRQEVTMTVSEKIVVDTESQCSFSSETTVQKVTFALTSGEKLPNSYSKNANPDGTLSEVFLCKESRFWMVAPGACK